MRRSPENDVNDRRRPVPPLSVGAVAADWRLALSNRSFLALFVGLVTFGTMRGVQETFSSDPG